MATKLNEKKTSHGGWKCKMLYITGLLMHNDCENIVWPFTGVMNVQIMLFQLCMLADSAKTESEAFCHLDVKEW